MFEVTLQPHRRIDPEHPLVDVGREMPLRRHVDELSDVAGPVVEQQNQHERQPVDDHGDGPAPADARREHPEAHQQDEPGAVEGQAVHPKLGEYADRPQTDGHPAHPGQIAAGGHVRVKFGGLAQVGQQRFHTPVRGWCFRLIDAQRGCSTGLFTDTTAPVTLVGPTHS